MGGGGRAEVDTSPSRELIASVAVGGLFMSVRLVRWIVGWGGDWHLIGLWRVIVLVVRFLF